MFRQAAYQVFLSTNGKNDRSCALDNSPVMLSDRPPWLASHVLLNWMMPPGEYGFCGFLDRCQPYGSDGSVVSRDRHPVRLCHNGLP
jgi:hypothetical protein